MSETLSSPNWEISTASYPDQNDFVKQIINQKYSQLCFGGSIGSGKTSSLLVGAAILCKVYPKSRYLFCMRDVLTLRRNLFPSFYKIFPPKFIKDFNTTLGEATMINGSQVLFMSESTSSDQELNRFKGLEICAAFLPNMETLKEETFRMISSRCGRWQCESRTPKPFIAGDSNPSVGWVKRMFYEPYRNGTLPPNMYYKVADIEKCPFATEVYKQNLKEAYRGAPELYEQFVRGSWEAFDQQGQLVSWGIMDNCKPIIQSNDNNYFLGCDIGWLGSDPSQICLMKGTNIIELKAFPKSDTVETTEHIAEYAAKYHIPDTHIAVDAVGIGGGVSDQLRKIKKLWNIIVFQGSEKATDYTTNTAYSFTNLKAFSYWTARTEMMEGRIGGFVDETLRSQTGEIQYSIHGDKEIIMESKQQLKARIGRSPDLWDSFVLACWAKWICNRYSTVGIWFTGTKEPQNVPL